MAKGQFFDDEDNLIWEPSFVTSKEGALISKNIIKVYDRYFTPEELEAECKRLSRHAKMHSEVLKKYKSEFVKS